MFYTIILDKNPGQLQCINFSKGEGIDEMVNALKKEKVCFSGKWDRDKKMKRIFLAM